jgi:tRNA(fMet)-specific endonuclease VapC
MRGWLAGIRRSRDIVDEVRPYDQLIKLVGFFQAWEILRFDENSAARFRTLRQQRVRIGSLDLKIAGIALESGATLLPDPPAAAAIEQGFHSFHAPPPWV